MTEITPSQEKFQLILKPKASPRRKSRSKFTLRKHTLPRYTVWLNGKDATPKPIHPNNYMSARERALCQSSMEGSSLDSSCDKMSGVRFFQNQLLADNGNEMRSFSKLSSNQDELLEIFQAPSKTPTAVTRSSSGSTFSSASTDPSVSETVTTPENLAPARISLILSETETIYLLSFTSCVVDVNSDESERVEEDNKHYEFLTSAKGRQRRVTNTEAQTAQVILKSRSICCPPIIKKNNFSLANHAEVYDTYQKLEKSCSNVLDKGSNNQIEADSASIGTTDFEVHKLDEIMSEDSYRGTTNEERELLILERNPRFFEAACVIQRLLASNNFMEPQKRFKGMFEGLDPMRKDLIEYKYRLDLLWTFSNEDTHELSVNAFDISKENGDLIAVGYGRFFLDQETGGLVLIWNMKNPVQPERKYRFSKGVNALRFSEKNPNLLAVGFIHGHVIVLNVVSLEKQIIAQNVPLYEVVNHLSFAEGRAQHADKELLFAATSDGWIIIYIVENNDKIQGQKIMRVAKAEGKMKGYIPIRSCSNLVLPANSYASAVIVTHHPKKESLYYVSTNQGIVHKCSTNYLHQHLDLFSAHDGPINALKFSPFHSNIFATCGDDWFVRIWCEDIDQPLYQLYVGMRSVQDLDWSPIHATIIATIQENKVLLWDFERKCYKPQSVTEIPLEGKSRNTVVKFTSCGTCLVVGDSAGRVFVFALEDMPFESFYPVFQMYRAFKNSLETEEALWNALKVNLRDEILKRMYSKPESIKKQKQRRRSSSPSPFSKSEISLQLSISRAN